MPAEVVSLAERRRVRSLVPRDRSRPQAEVRGSLVYVLATDRDTCHTPAATRAYAAQLLKLADSAEGAPACTLSEADLRARLALLGDTVERLDLGVGEVADLMALVRLLTAEVRGG